MHDRTNNQKIGLSHFRVTGRFAVTEPGNDLQDLLVLNEDAGILQHLQLFADQGFLCINRS